MKNTLEDLDIEGEGVARKQCSRCSVIKSLSDYYFDKSQNLYRADCKKCTNIKPKDKVKYGNLKKKFGLSKEQFDLMVEDQNGLCHICSKPETVIHSKSKEVMSLSVDHNKITGQIRGLLCQRCNIGLGFFQESEQALESAVAYVRKYKQI